MEYEMIHDATQGFNGRVKTPMDLSTVEWSQLFDDSRAESRRALVDGG
jgi:hypothetical protein